MVFVLSEPCSVGWEVHEANPYFPFASQSLLELDGQRIWMDNGTNEIKLNQIKRN